MVDADEAWMQIISALKACLKGSNDNSTFIDEYMSLTLSQTYVRSRRSRLTSRLTCVEAPTEPPATRTEHLLKLECNITINTNFMVSGILDVS